MAYQAPFFRRRQEQRGEIPDTFSYELPVKVRRQILYILEFVHAIDSLEKICLNMRFELGVNELWEPGMLTPECIVSYTNHMIDECAKFFLATKNHEYALTILEYIGINSITSSKHRLIDVINHRLQHERVGYKLVVSDNQCFLIQIEDETFLEKCTNRTLGVLSAKKYSDCLNHYVASYDKLSRNEYDDALVEVVRAIESLLKTRFTETGIAFDSQKDTLARLLDLAQKHIAGASHDFQYFKQIILDAGRARNKHGGHGVAEGQKVPLEETYVRFIINQAAANLLFLAEIELRS